MSGMQMIRGVGVLVLVMVLTLTSVAATHAQLDSDGRINPQNGDRIAVYCRPAGLDVYGITPEGSGVQLTFFSYAELLAAGLGGTTRNVGELGAVTAGASQAGEIRAAWSGGKFSASGGGDFAKLFTCAIPALGPTVIIQQQQPVYQQPPVYQAPIYHQPYYPQTPVVIQQPVYQPPVYQQPYIVPQPYYVPQAIPQPYYVPQPYYAPYPYYIPPAPAPSFAPPPYYSPYTPYAPYRRPYLPETQSGQLPGTDQTAALNSVRPMVSLGAGIKQRAVVEADAAELPEAPVYNPQFTNWSHIYVVREGDSLWSIGLKFGFSPYMLAQFNGLSEGVEPAVGDQIRIPSAFYP